MAMNANQLLGMSQAELDALFSAHEAGPIPDGEAAGAAIIAPGTVFRASCRKADRSDFFVPRRVGAAWSGRGGPQVDDADDLIDGERDDAEHEMAFDLERAADAEKSGAELVFQPGVDAFGHGAEIVDPVGEVGHVDELEAPDLAAHSALPWWSARKLRSTMGAWPSARLWSWIAAAS